MPRSKTKKNDDEPRKAHRYWNARWRRATDQNEKHWKPIRCVSRHGLICDIVEEANGSTRTVSLEYWEIELAGTGPRGGETWTDVVLLPEGTYGDTPTRQSVEQGPESGEGGDTTT